MNKVKLRNLGAPWQGRDYDGIEIYLGAGESVLVTEKRARQVMDDYPGRFVIEDEVPGLPTPRPDVEGGEVPEPPVARIDPEAGTVPAEPEAQPVIEEPEPPKAKPTKLAPRARDRKGRA